MSGWRRFAAVAAVAALSWGCGGSEPRNAESGRPGIANPATEHCQDAGAREEVRTDADGGEYGVCVFADGSECDSWAFYRADCLPGS